MEKLTPEERANLAINMTDVCVHVCAAAVKDQDETISEEELVERVRERIRFAKQNKREVQKLETFEEFIRRIISSLNDAGPDYMFTGALVASYYGTPRTTTDVDIVVKAAPEDVQTKLVLALKKADLQVEERRIHAALESGFGIATFSDRKSPFTLDVILSDKKLDRKAGIILGLRTFLQTPEDLILAKLCMIKAAIPKQRTLKDEEDIKAIMRFTKLDVDALNRQAKKNKTLSTLKSIVAGAVHEKRTSHKTRNNKNP